MARVGNQNRGCAELPVKLKGQDEEKMENKWMSVAMCLLSGTHRLYRTTGEGSSEFTLRAEVHAGCLLMVGVVG